MGRCLSAPGAGVTLSAERGPRVKLSKLDRLERAYRTLLSCNRLVIRGPAEPELLREMCAIAVREAGYRLAWVGYKREDASRTVSPAAQFGFEAGYLEGIHVAWDEGPYGRGPTGTAIRTGRACVVQDVLTHREYGEWREQALQRGYASTCAVPLRDEAGVFGAFNLYAAEPDAFDAHELELLQELGNDLAHGVHLARERVRVGKLELALRRAEKLETVGRVAASIVHDVNNFLAVISPALLDLRTHRQGPRAQQALQDIEQATQEAARLNREVLRFASVAPSNEILFQPDEVAERLWPILRRQLKHHQQASARFASRPWQISMDAVAFEQVLTNLVVNARDAIADRGALAVEVEQRTLSERLTAEAGLLDAGEYVVLTVRDDGPGIPPEVRDRLFEPFFTTKGERGTGLGLATVMGCVRQARGGIVVTSEPGHGAQFEVYLPRAS